MVVTILPSSVRGISKTFPSVSLVVSGIMAAAALYIVGSTVWMSLGGIDAVPFWDQWDNLFPRLDQPAMLFAQHNEHRIVLPRLFFALDNWLAGGSNAINIAVILIFQALCASLLALVVTQGVRSNGMRVGATALIVALLFSAAQHENFLWGFQVQFVGVLLCAVATLAAVLWGPGQYGLAAVLTLAAASVGMMSSGLIVPFFVVVLEIALRRPPWRIAILAVAALVLTTLYLRGFVNPHAHPLDPILRTPWQTIHHLLVQLGAPFASIASAAFGLNRIEVASWIGACGLAGFAGLTGRILLVDRRPQRLALIAMAGFILAFIATVAMGRAERGLEQAFSSRYTTPALAFWAILLTTPLLLARSRRTRAGAWLLALLCMVTLAGGQSQFIAFAQTGMTRRRMAAPVLLTGVNDQEKLSEIYFDPAIPLQRLNLLRQHQLGVFAEPWAVWLGTPLADHVQFAPPTACRGQFALAYPLPPTAAASDGAWGVLGWAASSATKAALRRVVFADAAGKMVGYAVGALPQTAVGSRLSDGHGEPNWWAGDISATAAETVQAYAFLDGFALACPIGTAARVSSKPQLRVELAGQRPAIVQLGGNIDSLIVGPETYVRGWAQVQGDDRHFIIEGNIHPIAAELRIVARPDVVQAMDDQRLVRSGFELIIRTDPAIPLPTSPRLCIFSVDPVYGARLLGDPLQSSGCDE